MCYNITVLKVNEVEVSLMKFNIKWLAFYANLERHLLFEQDASCKFFTDIIFYETFQQTYIYIFM